MQNTITTQLYRRFIFSGVAICLILVAGTVGYWFIGARGVSLVDCLYMTVITITTIGYGEIIDLTGNPGGRIFTMVIALSGIGVITYTLSNFTAFIIEGELNEAFRRKKMEKMIKKFRDHYIVCGIDGEGYHIVSELYQTKRPHVIVDIDRKNIEKILEAFHDKVYVEGDATDNDTLIGAGIAHAKGLFAATGDDNQNLVICLTARQLNPNIRIAARCNDFKNIEKMKRAGADAVISPTFIGGLRIASEMIRPTVVSFLDIMLRDKDRNLRIEEVPVLETSAGKTISALELKKHLNTLLMAVKTPDDWKFNPPDDYIVRGEDTLIVMTTPEDMIELGKGL